MRIIDFFDRGAAYHPENTAFLDDSGEALSYHSAKLRTQRIASALRSNGYHKGARVAVYAPNSNEAFIALLGLLRAECVWVPLNPRNPPAVNAELLMQFSAELVFHAVEFREQTEQIEAIVGNHVRFVQLTQGGSGESVTEFTADSGGSDFEQEAEEPSDLLAIFPTGGTTGKSKGVLMAHKAVETFAANFHAAFSYSSNDRHLVVAPMTHTAGLLGALHFPHGGCNIMMAAPDPVSIVDAIDKQGITHLFVPPTLLYMMLEVPGVRDRDYSSLKHLFVGAAPSSLAKLRTAIEVFGPVITEAYGQTEAPAAICCKPPSDYIANDGSISNARLASVGRPALFNRVRIATADGKEAARNEPGEIQIIGDLVNPGYLDDPEATRSAKDGAWHRTGDVGVMDDDGFVTIVDRIKDMIITGGFNVYPNEVEQSISAMPEVQECSVFGIPDEKWGETVVAAIVLRTGCVLDEEAVSARVKTELGSVKAPKKVHFQEALPKSPAGKVLKTDLRDRYS